MSIDQVIQKLKESEEQIKKDILTEFKIKEGAEKMRAVSDRKSKDHVGTMIKKATTRLDELQESLQSVRTYILMAETSGSLPKPNGKSSWEVFVELF